MSIYLPTNIQEETTLGINRWLELVNSLINIGGNVTVSSITAELNSIAQSYEHNISQFLHTVKYSNPNQVPYVQDIDYNVNLLKINLGLLYKELNTTNKLAVSLFNRIATEKLDLTRRINKLASKTRSLALYNTGNKLGRYAGDSFTTTDTFVLDTVNKGTNLNIDTEAGLATLPVVKKELLNIKTVSIDKTYSNGTVGNSSEAEALYSYDNLWNTIDQEPNSWWEYELVVADVSKSTGVRLSLILGLEEVQIVNQVNISLLNMGTVKDIVIDSVHGSIDGNSWFDLTTDLPLMDYFQETHADLLKVTSSTSTKTNSVPVYFNPVGIKYVRVRLSQSEAIKVFRTNTKIVHKYAIGIRDISLFRNSYGDSGLLISKALPIVPPINTLLLVGAVSDTSNGLFDIDFNVGFKQGEYKSIQLMDLEQFSQEVINVSDFDLDPFSIDSIYWKVDVTRDNTKAITNGPTKGLYKTEAFTKSSTNPTTYTLGKKPILNTVAVMESPLWYMGSKITVSGLQDLNQLGTIDLDLPLYINRISNGYDISFDDVSIFVNGVEWDRSPDLSLESSSDSLYQLVNTNDSDTTVLKIQNANGYPKIELYIKPQPATFTRQQDQFIGQLNYDGASDKANYKLEVQSLSANINQTIQPGQTLVKLNGPIDISNWNPPSLTSGIDIKEYNSSGSSIASVVYTDPKVFVNGTTELTNAGDYSIDSENGLLYSYSPSSETNTTTISYKWYKINSLNQIDFDLFRQDNKVVGVSVPYENFQSNKITEVVGADRVGNSFVPLLRHKPNYWPSVVSNYGGGKVIYLSHGNVIKNTLSLDKNMFTNPELSLEEVSYIDGARELLPGRIVAEQFPIQTVGSPGVVSYVFAYSMYAPYGIVFNSGQDVFTNQVGTLGAVVAPGDWFINYGTGTLSVWLASSTTEIIDLSYMYFQSSSTNRYSVDYNTGRVFLNQTVTPGFGIDYEYSIYRVSYPVANYVDFTINDKMVEINNNLTKLNTLEVSYQYDLVSESTAQLHQYYTPFIRDIQFRYL